MSLPLPGWYRDEQNQNFVRWWDGSAWTERVQPAVAPAYPQQGAGQNATGEHSLNAGQITVAGYKKNQSKASYWAMWLTVATPLTCGAVAPFAIGLGIKALVDIKKNPELTGAGSAWTAIMVPGIFLLLVFTLLFGLIL